MEAFYVLLALITPSGVTYQLMEMDYPTYQQCVNAGIAEATYRRNRTTKVKFSCVMKNSKLESLAPLATTELSRPQSPIPKVANHARMSATRHRKQVRRAMGRRYSR